MHSRLYQLKRVGGRSGEGDDYKKGPVKNQLANLGYLQMHVVSGGAGAQVSQSIMMEKLNCKWYLEHWAGTAPRRELMETERTFLF